MIATQSHGMMFENFPPHGVRGPATFATLGKPPMGSSRAFTAVIVGIVETALDTARRQLERRASSLGAYEQVEWTHAEMEGWLIQQAFDGMLRSMEQKGSDALRDALLGKTAVAELAESCMGRLCRVIGGGTYARRSRLVSGFRTCARWDSCDRRGSWRIPSFSREDTLQ